MKVEQDRDLGKETKAKERILFDEEKGQVGRGGKTRHTGKKRKKGAGRMLEGGRDG